MDPLTDIIVVAVMIISLLPNIVIQGEKVRSAIETLGSPQYLFKPRTWYENWAHRVLEGPNSNLASALIFIIPILIGVIWVRFWVLVPSWHSFWYAIIVFQFFLIHFSSMVIRLVIVRRTKRYVREEQL